MNVLAKGNEGWRAIFLDEGILRQDAIGMEILEEQPRELCQQ
jgi:hypothetical protein